MSKDSTNESRSGAAGSVQEYPYTSADPEVEDPTAAIGLNLSPSSADESAGPSEAGNGEGKKATSFATHSSRTAAKGSGNQKGDGDASRGASRTPAKAAKSSGKDGAPTRSGPRRVRLTLSRVDPRSVMKLSFLVAIAFGVATVVAVALLWNILEVTGMWSAIDTLASDLAGGEGELPFMEYFEFSKMISYATVVAVADIFIITALGTLLALLYNIVATLLGGLKVTFTDE